MLIGKNRELVDICKEWENKYASRLDEVKKD